MKLLLTLSLIALSGVIAPNPLLQNVVVAPTPPVAPPAPVPPARPPTAQEIAFQKNLATKITFFTKSDATKLCIGGAANVAPSVKYEAAKAYYKYTAVTIEGVFVITAAELMASSMIGTLLQTNGGFVDANTTKDKRVGLNMFLKEEGVKGITGTGYSCTNGIKMDYFKIYMSWYRLNMQSDFQTKFAKAVGLW